MQKQTYSLSFVALSVFCATCLVVSNLLAVKQFDINIFGLFTVPSTAGLIIFPFSYIINDCIVEVWGYRKAKFLIWLSFLADFFVIGLLQISVVLPPAPHWADIQNAYASVLSQTPRIVVASLIAFLAGSFMNAIVMSKMKRNDGKHHFAKRAIYSTIAGELIDTTIFTTLGFLGVIPFKVLLSIIATETILKIAYEIVILPITTQVVKVIKKYDGTDVIDSDVNYNPFKLR